MRQDPANHEAIAVLQKWSHRQPVSVTLVSGGFSGASIFQVQTDSGIWCLRRWPAGESAARLRAIHQVIQHATIAGVPEIPVPEPADDGQSLAGVGQTLWQLERWMPGVADFHKRPTAQRLQSAMTVLAQWHHATARYSPCDSDREWIAPPATAPSPTVRERIESMQFLVANLRAIDEGVIRESDAAFREAATRIAVCFNRLQDRIVGELDSVRETAVPLLPCIRDVWHDHLLYSGDELTGLIDFGAVRTDTVACDLSRLLGSLFGSSQTHWPTAFAAYESVRQLSLSELALIGPLHRSGILLSGMTWLKRRYLLHTLHDLRLGIIERLNQIADAVESLDTVGETMTAGGLFLP